MKDKGKSKGRTPEDDEGMSMMFLMLATLVVFMCVF